VILIIVNQFWAMFFYLGIPSFHGVVNNNQPLQDLLPKVNTCPDRQVPLEHSHHNF
jgi:hypothetical protein